MARVVDFTSGMEPTADQFDALVSFWAHLTSDHADITSDTSVDVVTGLSFDLPSGYTIKFGAVIIHNSASNTPDLDLIWNYSGTTSLYRDWSIGTAAGITGAVPTAISTQGSNTSATEYTHGTAANDIPAFLEGIMTTTSAGTLDIRAAQNVSNGTAVKIRAGSHIWAKLMA